MVPKYIVMTTCGTVHNYGPQNDKASVYVYKYMQWSTYLSHYYLIIYASSLLREVIVILIFTVLKANGRSVAKGLVGVSEQKKKRDTQESCFSSWGLTLTMSKDPYSNAWMTCPWGGDKAEVEILSISNDWCAGSATEP